MELVDFIHIYAEAKGGKIYDPAILAEAEAFANDMIEKNSEQAEKWKAIASWLCAEKIENGK